MELWETNGTRIPSKTPDVLTALQLPKHATATEILNFHPRRGRVYQWWLSGRPVYEGAYHDLANFKLESAFGIPPTNDYLLQIAPLVYKVDTDGTTAHLIEFPPVKVKLKSGGEVQKIREDIPPANLLPRSPTNSPPK